MAKPRSPDPSEPSGPADPGVEALLDRAAQALDAADLATATDALNQLAAVMPDDADRGMAVGRALWLASMVSLGQGRLEEFAFTSTEAVAAMEEAGEVGAAADARAAQQEILERLERTLDVQTRGAIGLLAALEDHVARLLEVATGAADWDAVDRDRAQLGELTALPADASGRVQPFVRVVAGLGLDPIEIAALAVLVALANQSKLAAAAHDIFGEPEDAPGFRARDLARFSLEREDARDALIDRLSDRGRLIRYRLIDVVADGAPGERRVAARGDLLWFLRDLPLAELPRPPGLEAWGAGPSDLTLMGPLRPALVQMTAALRARRPFVVVLHGVRGAGKATVALAAAAAAGRSLVVVDPERVVGSTEEATAVGMRDALLHDGALLARLDRGLASIAAALVEPRLPLIVSIDPADAADLLPELRRHRADLVVVDVPTLPMAEQASIWAESTAALGLPSFNRDDVDELLVRPGLRAGDLAEVLVAAVAAAATGAGVDARAVATLLDDRLCAELALAEELITPPAVVALQPSLMAEVDAVAASSRGGDVEVDGWSVGAWQSRRPTYTTVALVGAAAWHASAVARALAAALNVPLVRVDARELETDDSARIERLAANAGRASAVVWIDRAEVAIGRAARAVAAAMERALSTWIISPTPGTELPPRLLDKARRRIGGGGGES